MSLHSYKTDTEAHKAVKGAISLYSSKEAKFQRLTVIVPV